MPFSETIGQSVTTVSQKLTELTNSGLSAVNGVAGTLSSGINAGFNVGASALNAWSNKATDALKTAGLSVTTLNQQAAQVTQALAPISIYKGIPAVVKKFEDEQPQRVMDEQRNRTDVLRFPEDIGVHHIIFTFSSFAQKSPIQPATVTNQKSIILPMTSNLQETYQANYKQEALGITGTAAEKIANSIKNNMSGGVDMTTEGGKQFGAALNKAIKDIGNDEEFTAGVVGTVAARAAQAVVGPVASAVSQQLGATTNPNLAVLFDNISFRAHQFSFRLFPKSKKESDVLKQVIQVFRERMLPTIIGGGLGYAFPDKCSIQIKPQSPFPILECVLESMTINYAPNGPAFFKGDGSDPVVVDISLNFKEIVLMDRKKAQGENKTPVDGSIPKTGSTTPNVNDVLGSARTLGSIAAQLPASSGPVQTSESVFPTSGND
jgi:hypothetical protein